MNGILQLLAEEIAQKTTLKITNIRCLSYFKMVLKKIGSTFKVLKSHYI